MASACRPDPPAQAPPAPPSVYLSDTTPLFRAGIRNGDLIVRTGNDFTSDALRSLCRTDKTYSHCGWVVETRDGLRVIHALGGEWNPDQTLCCESLADFINPRSNRGYGLFRFSLNEWEAVYLNAIVLRYWQHKLRFDMAFNAEDDERMYCAEFTAKTLAKATQSRLQIPLSQLGQFRFFAPDNLTTHPACRPVVQVRYETP